MLADIEDGYYRELVNNDEELPPVSITALPRAGTTVLLRLLWQSGEFASHLYRDVPLTLAPMLWQRFRARFAAEPTERERPHGDGIAIDAECPEAFEEMLWKASWPHHYRGLRIEPWSLHERADSFDAFYRRHRRKIVALREAEYGGRRRYLTKNNVHIARLAHPPAVVREGTMVIMVREPVAHAASLQEQHVRLCALQEENPFLRAYMAGIGHHDFGQTLKPINVGGWLDHNEHLQPRSLEYWLRYWVAAYTTVLEQLPDNAVLCSYDRLYRAPQRTLANIEDVLGLTRNALTEQAPSVREPRSHVCEEPEVPKALSEEAAELHASLVRWSL
jgi:hypothetical protein